MSIYICGFIRIRIKVMPKGTIFVLHCTLKEMEPDAKDDCKNCDMKIKVIE